jgi:hypothetical protein
MATFLDVDPRNLRLPPSRRGGADLAKLARQIQQFGNTIAGLPSLQVTRAARGELVINDGVTRASRVAKLLPGQLIRVEVIDDRPAWDVSRLPKIEDTLP